MKNIPNKKDEEFINETIRSNILRTYSALKASKIYNFAVGDIIIKNHVEEIYDNLKDDWTGKYRMEPVTVSSNNFTPKKFKVVAVDEFGIPWIRQINSKTGKEGDKLESLGDYNSEYIRFTPDTAQADAVLVGDEASYDPLEQAKLIRKQIANIRKENDKKAFTSDNCEEWGKKFKSLTRNQEVWFYTYGPNNSKWTYFKNKEEVEAMKVRVLSISTIKTLKELKTSTIINNVNLEPLTTYESALRCGNEIVIMRYITKNYNNSWKSAKDAEFVTNIGFKGFFKVDISKMILYTEEPSNDETK